jgi:hypothetical protein
MAGGLCGIRLGFTRGVASVQFALVEISTLIDVGRLREHAAFDPPIDGAIADVVPLANESSWQQSPIFHGDGRPFALYVPTIRGHALPSADIELKKHGR